MCIYVYRHTATLWGPVTQSNLISGESITAEEEENICLAYCELFCLTNMNSWRGGVHFSLTN